MRRSRRFRAVCWCGWSGRRWRSLAFAEVDAGWHRGGHLDGRAS